MFFPESRIRVFLYGEPCDMRKSFNGLSGLVKHAIGEDPLSVVCSSLLTGVATTLRLFTGTEPVIAFGPSVWRVEVLSRDVPSVP